jgi:HSP20 family protein
MTGNLTRWDPFAEMAPVREMMSRFFDDPYWGTTPMQSAVKPLALDVFETEDAVVVKAALPGFDEKDVDVTIEHGNLTIRARRADATTGNGTDNVRWVHRELWPGEYARSIILPGGLQADKSEATYNGGILTLHVPKAESARPRQIKVQAKAG